VPANVASHCGTRTAQIIKQIIKRSNSTLLCHAAAPEHPLTGERERQKTTSKARITPAVAAINQMRKRLNAGKRRNECKGLPRTDEQTTCQRIYWLRQAALATPSNAMSFETRLIRSLEQLVGDPPCLIISPLSRLRRIKEG